MSLLRSLRVTWWAWRHGEDLISAPPWLAAELAQRRFERQAERAAERWEAKVSDVTLEEWEQAYKRHHKG